MSDLIKKLRDPLECPTPTSVFDLCREAADELEQQKKRVAHLCAALGDIARHSDDCYDGDLWNIHGKAIEALLFNYSDGDKQCPNGVAGKHTYIPNEQIHKDSDGYSCMYCGNPEPDEKGQDTAPRRQSNE